MDKYSLEFITNYIKNDNNTNLQLFNQLYSDYQKSLLDYEQKINILGIYFYDILKILTHINLKINEINNNLEFKINKKKKLLNFPYYSVEDIKKGINVTDKKYGKKLSDDKKKIFKKLINFKNLLISKKNIITSYPIKIDDNYLFYSINKKTKKNYIYQYYIGKDIYKIPLLNEQLIKLEIILNNIEKKLFMKIKNLRLSEIIKLHIKANCKDGKEKFKINSDYFIIESGVELKNRIASSIAKQSNIKIIQISHGDCYGVFDEPIWSSIGDQFNADYILGYGDGYIKYNKFNKFSLNKNAIYINGTSKIVDKIQKDNAFNKNYTVNDLKFVYFPTTFSGYTKRHGPYRDMPDNLYQKWHFELNNLFKKKLIFKVHPKEDYIELFNKDLIVNKDQVSKYFRVNHVLIFDHISTAFNIAASSNNQIIYFDLGTRNLNNEALNFIKKRTLYFKIEKELPKLDELLKQLSNKYIDYSYVENFCIGLQETRLKSLINMIK